MAKRMMLALAILILFPAIVLADKPPVGTLDLLNTPQSPGYAMFHVTWANQVRYPAFWLSCAQGGVVRYVENREPVEGDGEATFSVGIPTGETWWAVDGGPATCTASLQSYRVQWRPVVRVINIEMLDELAFRVDVH